MSGVRVPFLASNRPFDCSFFGIHTVAEQAVLSSLTEAQIKEDYCVEFTIQQFMKFAWRVKRWRFTGTGALSYNSGGETGDIDFSMPVTMQRFRTFTQAEVDAMATAPDKFNQLEIKTEKEMLAAARDGLDKLLPATGKHMLQNFNVPVEVHDPALPPRPIPASQRRVINRGFNSSAAMQTAVNLPLSTSLNDDTATILKGSFMYRTVKGWRRAQADSTAEKRAAIAQAGGNRLVGDVMTFWGPTGSATEIPGYDPDDSGAYYLAVNGAVTRTPPTNKIPVGVGRNIRPPDFPLEEDFWRTVYQPFLQYPIAYDAVYDPTTRKIRVKLNLSGGPMSMAADAHAAVGLTYPSSHLVPAASSYGPVGNLKIALDADTEIQVPLYTKAGPGGSSEAQILLIIGLTGTTTFATGSPSVSMNMRLAVEKYWPFSNKNGEAIYNEDTGVKIHDP
jgi:hypothetical protein